MISGQSCHYDHSYGHHRLQTLFAQNRGPGQPFLKTKDLDFPGGPVVKNLPAWDTGSIPGSGRPAGEGNVCLPIPVEFYGRRNLVGYSP